MKMTRPHSKPRGMALIVCALGCLLPLSAADLASEVEQLKQMLADQQRQINELRHALEQKDAQRDGQKDSVASAAPITPLPSLGQVASTVAIMPAGSALSALGAVPQAQPAAPAVNVNELNNRVNGLIRNLAGFRFSGDFRYRFDLQDRSANTVAPALQNARSRYRLRFNIDKDLFYKDGDDRPLARAHIQLSTAPYSNPLTNDTDFTGFSTKAPFSVAEAYVDVMPVKALTLRIGRTQEIFADNRQFIWDDDIRFNGFQETYRLAGKNGFFAEVRAGQYILANPNVQIVPASSPYLTAGYSLGQRVPSPGLFDQGIVVGSNLGSKWRTDFTIGYSTVREPNQIQLASSAGTGFASNPVLGATLIANMPQVGNATTTAGGAIYSAGGFDVIHYGGNLNYAGSMVMGHNFPFALFLQGTHNKEASNLNNGYMLGASYGQAARLGDIQVQYAYFYKPANAFVSQFTDDDVGTGTGVNIKDHTIRVNFGITRFLAWENRLFIQHGISRNDPAHNFFVPLQQGYNTLFRYQSHLAFTF